jgi:hypothetical protein
MKSSLALPAIVTDAYGGYGGIAQYNHDFLGALAGAGTVFIDYGFVASSTRHYNALALSPSLPLPETIRLRAKTGLGVPTGNWMTHATGSANLSTKGQASRERLEFVLKGPVTQSIARVT